MDRQAQCVISSTSNGVDQVHSSIVWVRGEGHGNVSSAGTVLADRDGQSVTSVCQRRGSVIACGIRPRTMEQTSEN